MDNNNERALNYKCTFILQMIDSELFVTYIQSGV
jgi:hypothetical protein